MDRSIIETVENMKSNLENFHHGLPWEQIIFPRNILWNIPAFIVLVVFIYKNWKGCNSIQKWFLKRVWRVNENSYRRLSQIAVWGLLRAWVWFIETVLTGQLILWGSNTIKSTEQFSCVLHQLHILGAQIKNWKSKKTKICCSTLKALKIYGHWSLQQWNLYLPKGPFIFTRFFNSIQLTFSPFI